MDVWECALGFMDSQTLLTAEELGVFDTLDDGPKTVSQVASAVGIPDDSALRLLTALCALELVERQEDGRYVNGPEADAQLVKGKPGYVGDMFVHVREHLYPIWHYFREALEEGEAQWDLAFEEQPTVEMYSDPETLRAFMDGMHAITYEAAAEFAAQAPELKDVSHLVDVGGASGAFVIALAEAYPSMKGTVLDLPQVRPIARDYFRAAGLNDRLDFHAADFFNDPMPTDADAFSLGFVLHDWNTEQGSYLLDSVSQALPAGGLLIVGEYLLNDRRTGPLFVARSDLNMLVAAQGRERSAQEYESWLNTYDFDLERIQPTSKGKHFLIARRR